MAEWKKEWPTKPGWYWFYGWPFGRDRYFKDDPPRLCMVSVHINIINNRITYVRDGQFFYKEECAVGLFKKAEVPDLPNLE